MRLEREIALLLRRSRAISARLAGELHPDLDGAAYGLLSLLQDAGPLRASELVTRIGLDKSTVSRQVAHLVDLGLVDRAADPVDGRAQVLTPRPRAPPGWPASATSAARAGRTTSPTGRRPTSPPWRTCCAGSTASARPARPRRGRPTPPADSSKSPGAPSVVFHTPDRRLEVVDSNQPAVWLRSTSNPASEIPMPITSETRDRLTASVSQLLRTGRHVSARAAGHLYGELPAFGWGLLIPLERDGDQRCSALAAPRRRRRLGRQPAARRPREARLRRAAARPAGRPGQPHQADRRRRRRARLGADLRAEWALTALAGWDEADARQLTTCSTASSSTCDRRVPAAARPAVPTPR